MRFISVGQGSALFGHECFMTRFRMISTSLEECLMPRFKMRASHLASLVVLLFAGGFSQIAAAVTFDFEPPTYSTGTIVGQDGWQANAYVLSDPFFGGVVNGTVDISTSSPLAGAQSVLYTQTVDPPTAGGTGASDVGNAGVVVARKHGSDAIDLTASALLQTDENSVGLGALGFFIGQGARSPIIVLINGTTAGGTGDILVGDAGGLPDKGDYDAGTVLEATVGVDLDNQNYDLFVRNVTAGTPAMQLLGSGPGGRFPFFGGSIADDGDGLSFTLDASLLLRSGVGRVDSITLTAVPEPAGLALAIAGLLGVAFVRRQRGY